MREKGSNVCCVYNLRKFITCFIRNEYAGSTTSNVVWGNKLTINQWAANFILKSPILGKSCKRVCCIMKLLHAETRTHCKHSFLELPYPLSSSLCNTNHCWLYSSLSFTFSLYLLLQRFSFCSSLSYGPELFSLIRCYLEGPKREQTDVAISMQGDWCNATQTCWTS